MYCGELDGESCGDAPDVMLMSVVLFFGTFSIAWALKAIKLSNFFPSTVRSFSQYSLTMHCRVWAVGSALDYIGIDTCVIPEYESLLYVVSAFIMPQLNYRMTDNLYP